MTIAHRQTGWLDNAFHFQFREILTHTCFRHGVMVPIYCLMPDHLHLLVLGYQADGDQRKAVRFLRKHTNQLLANRQSSCQLQKQPYDRVLREDERNPDAFIDLAWYIRANPHRAGLVSSEELLSEYSFSGCLAPGYPELDIWQDDYWDRFWRVFAYLTR